MAASVTIENGLFCPSDDNKNQDRTYLSALMERLRIKHSNQSSLLSSKAARLGSLEKKWTGDDATVLRKHQATVLRSIKAVSRSLIVDRLESIASDANVKFQADASKECVCLYTDEFSLKLIMNSKGKFVAAQISNNTETKVCPCLAKALNSGNFDELRCHLEGLLMLYCIDNDRTVRSKGTQALLSLESDLNTLSNFQRSISSVQSYIHKSPVGIVTSRIGGLQMKLTFFVGPYDLLNYRNKSMTPMTLEAITEQNVGTCATLGIEPSVVNCMQISPLITINKLNDGKSSPTSAFCPLTGQNSALLPLRFFLQLHRPLILSKTIINQIQQMTGLEIASPEKFVPLVPLLMEQITRGKVKSKNWNRQSNVHLPGQDHRYCFSGNMDLLHGALVSRIPFLHPTNVPQIITHLRQQVLFNTVIGSCLRRHKARGLLRELMFEVSPLSIQQVSVTFEHTSNCSLITADLDLSDLMAVSCKLGSCPDNICPSGYATMVFQRCLSLPITLRAIITRSAATLRSLTEPPALPSLPPFPLECFIRLQRQKRRNLLNSTTDPHAAMKLSAPLFIANNCIPSARGRQATKHNHNLHTHGNAKPDTMGVRELTVSSRACWETGAQGDDTEKQLKRLSENLVSVCSSKVAGIELSNGHVKSSSTSSHLTSASFSMSQMNAISAPASGSAVTKTNAVTATNSLQSKDSTLWSKCDRTPVVSLSNVRRHVSMPSKDPKGVSNESPVVAQPQATGQSYQPVHGCPDSSSTDSSKNAGPKRSWTSFTNPELIGLLAEPLSGQDPPLKKPHLDKRISEVSSSLEQAVSLPSSVGNGSNLNSVRTKPQDNSTKPLVKSSTSFKDVEALVRLEAQLREANAVARNDVSQPEDLASPNNIPDRNLETTTEVCSTIITGSVDAQIVSNDHTVSCDRDVLSADQKPFIDQRFSVEQKSAAGEKLGSPALFDASKNGTNKVSDEASLAEDAKTENTNGSNKSSASSQKVPSSDEDKPPIKVILNKKSLQQGFPGENLFPPTEHILWKERQRERKLSQAPKSSPLMPDYIVDLSVDNEVDDVMSDDLIASAVKASSGRSSVSPQLLKNSDRKDGIRPIKRPKISLTASEPGEKRFKKDDGRKPLKRKRSSDDEDDSSSAEDANSTGNAVLPVEKIKTIKITNSGGKLQIQNPARDLGLMLSTSGGKSPTIVARGSITPTPSSLGQRTSRPSPSSGTISASKISRPAILSSRVPNRSKSELGGGGTGCGGVDSKLIRTPTVKLNPLSVTANRSIPGAVTPYTGKLSTQLSAPGNRVRSGTSIDSKLARKGSLSSVIDTLYKKQHSGSSGSGRDAVVDQQKVLDAIRLQIIREGNKPSAPMRDSGGALKSSVMQSTMKKTDPVRIDLLKSVDIASKAPPLSHPKLPSQSKALNGLTGKTIMLGTTASTANFSTAVVSVNKSPIPADVSILAYKDVREPAPVVSAADVCSYEPAAAVPKSCTPCTTAVTSVPSSLLVSRPTSCDARIQQPSEPVISPSFLSIMNSSDSSQNICMMGMDTPPGNPPMSSNTAIVPYCSSSAIAHIFSPVPVMAANVGKPLIQSNAMPPVPGYSSKLNEITNRLARRHFTDVVACGNVNENKDAIDRRLSPPRSPSPVDESRQDIDDPVGCSLSANEVLLKVVDFSADDVTNAENFEISSSIVSENSTQESLGLANLNHNHMTQPEQTQDTDLSCATLNEISVSEKLGNSAYQSGECSVSKDDDLNGTLVSNDNECKQTIASEVTQDCTSHIHSPPPVRSPDNDPLRGQIESPCVSDSAADTKLNSSQVLESSCSGDGLSVNALSSPAVLSITAQTNGAETTLSSSSQSIKSPADVIILSPSPTKQSSPSSCCAVKSPETVQNNQSLPGTPKSACNSEDDLMDVALTL